MYVVFILLSARVPKDGIYPVLVTQARYVAPDISGVSKSRVKTLICFMNNKVRIHQRLKRTFLPMCLKSGIFVKFPAKICWTKHEIQ